MSLINIIGNTISSGFVAVGATISDFLFYDPDPEFVDNASITNRGTSGTNATGYSGKSYDFDGVSDFVTLSVSATLTYIELWVKPDTTTMAICDFGAGKEIALTTGTVGTTGLGTVSVTVDGVSSTTMVALKWQLLRVTLDSPTAITTLRLGRNDTTYGSGQISDVQINDSTSYLETNQASSTGIFDSVQGVLATNSGCALIESLSGFNYDPAVSEALKNDVGIYQVFGQDTKIALSSTVTFDTVGDYFEFTVLFNAYNNAPNPTDLLFESFSNYIRIDTDGKVAAQIAASGLEIFNNTVVPLNQITVVRFTKTVSGWDLTLNGSLTGDSYSTSSTFILEDFSAIGSRGIRESQILIQVSTNKGTWTNTNNWQGVGTAINGSPSGVTPHKQQFPEVGIPQSFSKNWNRYDYFGGAVNDDITINESLTNVGDYITIRAYANKILDPTSRIIIWGGGSNYLQIRYDTDNIGFRTSENVAHTHSSTPSANGFSIITLTKSSPTEYTLTYNGVSEIFTDSGTLGITEYGSYQSVNYPSYLANFEINGVLYNNYNNYQGKTVNFTPIKFLFPEDANNAGFDVGGTAIVDAQPKFKLDGASYLEGEVLTIDWNTAFSIEFDVVFYELGSSVNLFNNLDVTTLRGFQIYKDGNDNFGCSLINDINSVNSYLNTISSIARSANTPYSCVLSYSGNGLSSGFSLTVNGVDDPLTPSVDGLNQKSTVNTNSLNIGRRQLDDTRYLNGSITNFKFNYL